MGIEFSEATEKRIASGELVPIAMFLYEPATGLLHMRGLGPISLAEAKAMLRKYIDDIPEPVGDDE